MYKVRITIAIAGEGRKINCDEIINFVNCARRSAESQRDGVSLCGKKERYRGELVKEGNETSAGALDRERERKEERKAAK